MPVTKTKRPANTEDQRKTRSAVRNAGFSKPTAREQGVHAQLRTGRNSQSPRQKKTTKQMKRNVREAERTHHNVRFAS